MEDGKEQANPSIISNIWLPLVTAINTSCLVGTSPPCIFGREKDQGERRKKNKIGEIKKRKEPEPRAGDNV